MGAALLIFLTLHDVVTTVLSHQGAGPITNFWTRWVWSFILWLKRRFNIYFTYYAAGPTFLLGIIFVWYFLLNTGWLILLYVGDYTIKGKQDVAIEFVDYLYFLSSTFTTLGMGDYIPSGFPWTLVVTSGALVMSFLTTLSISYIIPVVSAVVDRRKMISAIDIIGRTPQEILDICWGKEDSGSLDSEVLGVSDSIVRESYRSHVYPILSYFNFGDSHSTLNIAVLNLFDAIALQEIFSEREGNIVKARRQYLMRAFDLYLDNLRFKISDIDVECGHQDFIRFLTQNSNGISLGDREDVVEKQLKRRCELLKLVQMEGSIFPDRQGKIYHPAYLVKT